MYPDHWIRQDHSDMDAKVKAIGERDREARCHIDPTIHVRYVAPWSLKADHDTAPERA